MEEVDNFKRYLKVEKNYSDYTISNYENDVLDFINYCSSNDLNIYKVKYLDIKPYLVILYDKNYKSTTLSRKISSLRAFYKYLFNNDKTKTNPFKYVVLPKKEKKLPKYLTIVETDNIFSEIKCVTPIDVRNKLIFELLYASGIRVSELCNIKLKDIDFDSKTITILGKGSKMRIVCFGNECKEVINYYVKNPRKELLNNIESEYLIVGKKKEKITTRNVEIIIDKVMEKLSIKKDISPHTLRHTFATHLLNDGCDILIVKELLGHSSLDTTGIYTHVSNEKLRNVYLSAHPRAKNSGR